MSLNTVLKIGNALRNSEGGLKHFKYMNKCKEDTDKETILRLSIPVKEDFSLDLDNITHSMPESEESKLYYLTFKTSDSDSLVKYIFGDIFYAKSAKINKQGKVKSEKTGGYYRLADKEKKGIYKSSSFERGAENYQEILKDFSNQLADDFTPSEIEEKVRDLALVKFRDHLTNGYMDYLEIIMKYNLGVREFLETPSAGEKNISFTSFLKDEVLLKKLTIERTLKDTNKQTVKKLIGSDNIENLSERSNQKVLEFAQGQIFIHFSFPDRKHWYEFKDEFTLINRNIFSNFVGKSSEGFVLKKTLYKTLCSGDKKNDIQFPGFTEEAKHKSKYFSDAEIQDLFFAVNYSKTGSVHIYGTDIKIIILPKGDLLKAKDYERFLVYKNESTILEADKEEDYCEQTSIPSLDSEESINITSFDVIFSKKGGVSSPDIDLIEISGVQKSELLAIKERIEKIATNIQKEKKLALKTNKNLPKITIEKSLINLLGSCQFDTKKKKVDFKPNPKYQSHILKILPQIYARHYYQDEILFPAFINQVEFSIRSGNPKYIFLKYDLEFLFAIQNHQHNKNLMDIKNSASYQIGLLLGKLARNFAGEKSPIKSFEKNYVGNLTRRIGSLNDFIKLKNDIEQKLIMHDKTRFTHKYSYELSQKIKDFAGRYDKEACAFGFFESYFEPIPKKNTD